MGILVDDDAGRLGGRTSDSHFKCPFFTTEQHGLRLICLWIKRIGDLREVFVDAACVRVSIWESVEPIQGGQFVSVQSEPSLTHRVIIIINYHRDDGDRLTTSKVDSLPDRPIVSNSLDARIGPRYIC